MKSKLQWLAASVAALAFTVPTLAAGDRAPYSAIVVFGTSLSDSGNAFALRGGANTPPDYLVNPLLIPDAPFARGGQHFTNGGTWVEQLARSLGLAGSVRPAYASGSLKATNYAVGAARAYDDGKNVNLSDQVQKFLEDYGGAAPSDALYVIEMGSNDIRDAFQVYASLGDGGPILTAALGSIAANIRKLHAADLDHPRPTRLVLHWVPD